MAQHAANFTTTSQARPSIIEVVAEETLNETLYSALQRIVQSISSERHLWIHRHYEKLYLLLNAGLQYYYLKRYDSTFAENFYGFKRISLNEKPVSDKLKFILAFHASFSPYLKDELKRLYDNYRREEYDGCLREGFGDKLKKYFVLTFPYLQTLWSSCLLLNYLRYISGKQESQTMALYLFNLKLVYSMDDMDSAYWLPLLRGQLSFADFSSGFVKNFLLGVWELLAFTTQFIQAVNTVAPNFEMGALPKVPAPDMDKKSLKFQEKCPICRLYWKLPTVLPISGYVFCFSCILKHLRQQQSCPVTLLPAKPLDIIRLIDTD